jgi:hypothetical protein
MFNDVDLSVVAIYAPLAVGIIAAGVSVYSARVSLRASRATLARDLVQVKIAALTSALNAINRVDTRTTLFRYGYLLGKHPDDPGLAKTDLFNSLVDRQVAARTEIISVGHFLTEQIHRRGEKLIEAANTSLDDVAGLLGRGDPPKDVQLAPLIKPIDIMVLAISSEIAKELEACVRLWEHTARVKWDRRPPSYHPSWGVQDP